MTPREMITMGGRQAAHLANDSAPKALDLSVPNLGNAITEAAWTTPALIAVGIAIWILRRLHARRLLNDRVSYTMLPSLSFEPTKEDVARFALQLTRTRPAESRWRPRRGSAVRIRLATDTDGRLTFSLTGPRHADSVLRHPTYAQVELRADDDTARISDLAHDD